MNNRERLRKFFPETVRFFNAIEIDLDETDLSVSDILRNINRSFPKNSKKRIQLIDGERVVIIVCKSKYLDPLDGIVLIVTNDDMEINISSINYMVLAISEENISNDDRIREVTDRLTIYLIQVYKDTLANFNDFYVRYIYNEDDLFDDDNESLKLP